MLIYLYLLYYLMNTTIGQPMLEGTRISIDSKHEKASKFLMSATPLFGNNYTMIYGKRKGLLSFM